MGLVRVVTRAAGRLAELPPRWVLAIGFGLFLLYAFPGYMSTDSVFQLLEARSGSFSDAHPPLMSAEWWLLDRIISGPILMLLLQGSVLLAGLYVLMQRLFAPRPAAWAAIGLLLFPPVLTTMAVIWKDSQMLAFLVAGTAAVIQPRLRVRIGGLGLLVAACALRHNALAAVVPLVAVLFEWRPGMRAWRRLGIMAAAAVLTVGATFALTRVLTSQHVRLTPAFADVVGVIGFTHDRTDDDLREVLRGTPLTVTKNIQHQARILCDLHGTWRIVQGDDRMFTPPANDAEWSAMYRAWQELVLGDPVAYLAFHWDGFGRILGLYDAPLRAPVWNLFLEAPGEQMAPIDHDGSHSSLQVFLGVTCFYWLADHTPLFRPFVYALIALALLVLCCRDRLTFALFTSGLLYELSFFPVGAEPDYRYSHWMITSTCIAVVFLFVQRRRQQVVA